MDVVVTIAGIALVAFLARDVFHTLFHPEGRGALDVLIGKAVWGLARRAARRSTEPLVFAGPLIVALVIASWVVLAVTGWALMYWPQLPDGFLAAAELGADPGQGFLDAVYHSMVALTTLGYGDITPSGTWMRVIAPFEALVGFALLSASISWVVSIQPALMHMRALAGDIATLHGAAALPGTPAIGDLSARSRWDLLRDLEERLVQVHTDLDQSPGAYYFEPRDRRNSLAHALPVLSEFAGRCRTDDDPDLRFAGARVALEVERLARMLGTEFLGLPEADAAQIMRAYRDERTPSRRCDGVRPHI